MEEGEFRKKVKKLRELFKSRFQVAEIERVLRDNDDNIFQALDFLFKVDPAQVGRYLNKTKQDIERLREESCHLNAQLESGVLEVEASKRQFACRDCQRSWWRKVPIRKEVSVCRGCQVRFDSIPRDKEWGWGQFYCDGENCGRSFQGVAVMGMTRSMCHRCGYYVLVDHILPPNKRGRGEKRIDTHECNGVNCYARFSALLDVLIHTRHLGVNGVVDVRAVCIHPRSKPFRPADAIYRTWSNEHVHTGSTISTFLDQESLFSGTGSFAYSRRSSHE